MQEQVRKRRGRPPLVREDPVLPVGISIKVPSQILAEAVAYALARKPVGAKQAPNRVDGLRALLADALSAYANRRRGVHKGFVFERAPKEMFGTEPRILLRLPTSLLDGIEAYRTAMGLPHRIDAIVDLLWNGIRLWKAESRFDPALVTIERSANPLKQGRAEVTLSYSGQELGCFPDALAASHDYWVRFAQLVLDARKAASPFAAGDAG